jgi:hypothetical protein
LARCPLCEQRKGRRACPAKGETICAQCCGTKRLVLIDCPEDCTYLLGGAPGWARDTEMRRDARRFLAMTEGLDHAQLQLMYLALVGTTALRARHRGLDDHLLSVALSALRRTTETRMNGVVYEHAPEDARAQGLVRELQSLFEAEDDTGRRQTPADRDVLDVLRGLEAGLLVSGDTSPTSFLDSVVRAVGRRAAASAGEPKVNGPRLLLS